MMRELDLAVRQAGRDDRRPEVGQFPGAFRSPRFRFCGASAGQRQRRCGK